MPKVHVQPEGIEFEAEDGQTIMDAAHIAGLYWPTTCGGQGLCTSCACTVDEGADSLDSMSRSELETLAEELGETKVKERGMRLACQARVLGDVVVTKRGVRRDDA